MPSHEAIADTFAETEGETVLPPMTRRKILYTFDAGQAHSAKDRYAAMMKAAMADVLVDPMASGDIRPLFPLMQAAEPELRLDAWLGHARRMLKAGCGAKAGIMVARRRGQALPCGAVHYRLDASPRYGNLLTAEHAIALDLLYPQAVLAALFDALELQASQCGCGAIRSILRDSRSGLPEKLPIAGHRRDGTTFLKAL